MQQLEIFEKLSIEETLKLTHEEQAHFIKYQQDIIRELYKKIKSLTQDPKTPEQLILFNQKYLLLQDTMFGKSTEKSNFKPKENKSKKSSEKERRKRVLLPSERNPNLPIREEEVCLVNSPTCNNCHKEMTKTSLYESSEQLNLLPAKFEIIRQKKMKYSCKCCGNMKSTPNPARIKPGSSYSDETILYISISKYCDLIPVDRICRMAGRMGVNDFPTQSAIECTHYLADYVYPAYERIRDIEIRKAFELRADETPHKMLNKDSKGSLWGFSCDLSVFFEIHKSRSSQVASDFLSMCDCEYLVRDAYSGYGSAVDTVNKIRIENKKNIIKNIYCNAHARRYFVKAEKVGSIESRFYINLYRKVYHLESRIKDLFNKDGSVKDFKKYQFFRKYQEAYFRLMKKYAFEMEIKTLPKSALGKALRYFLKYYDELTLFLKINLSIDNNKQESCFRNPVIGRKIWFGTNSDRGARTAAILFSLVESCKLNNINPWDYFRCLIEALHQGQPVFTPHEFKESLI